MSYALYNYYKIDETKNHDAGNIGLIREFEGSRSETGFVAVHVAMVQHSGKLVTEVNNAIEYARLKEH